MQLSKVLPSVCPDTYTGWTLGLFPFLFQSGLVKSILHCSLILLASHILLLCSHPFILSEADQTHSLLAVYYLCICVGFPSKVQRWTWLCHLEKFLKHQEQSHVNPTGKYIMPSEMRKKNHRNYLYFPFPLSAPEASHHLHLIFPFPPCNSSPCPISLTPTTVW